MSASRLGAWVEYRAEDGVPLTATRRLVGDENMVLVHPIWMVFNQTPVPVSYLWSVRGPAGGKYTGTVDASSGPRSAFADAKAAADFAARACGWWSKLTSGAPVEYLPRGGGVSRVRAVRHAGTGDLALSPPGPSPVFGSGSPLVEPKLTTPTRSCPAPACGYAAPTD